MCNVELAYYGWWYGCQWWKHACMDGFHLQLSNMNERVSFSLNIISSSVSAACLLILLYFLQESQPASQIARSSLPPSVAPNRGNAHTYIRVLQSGPAADVYGPGP
jgi:hypothetical protein